MPLVGLSQRIVFPVVSTACHWLEQPSDAPQRQDSDCLPSTVARSRIQALISPVDTFCQSRLTLSPNGLGTGCGSTIPVCFMSLAYPTSFTPLPILVAADHVAKSAFVRLQSPVVKVPSPF